MTTIKELSDEPKYSIKTVSAQTGILPVTLRAWERRHELLSPHRSGNRYRLYSERDVAILRWIKNRTDAGISISQAVAELRSMARSGVSPDAIQGPVEPKVKQITAPLEEYALRLAQALMKHDEVAAEQVLDDLQDAIPLRDYCTRVLVPALVEIGEAWYNGKIRVATEHWASAFLRVANDFNGCATRIVTSMALLARCVNEDNDIDGANRIISGVNEVTSMLSALEWELQQYSDFALVNGPVVRARGARLFHAVQALIQRKSGDLEEIRRMQFEFTDAVRLAHSEILSIVPDRSLRSFDPIASKGREQVGASTD